MRPGRVRLRPCRLTGRWFGAGSAIVVDSRAAGGCRGWSTGAFLASRACRGLLVPQVDSALAARTSGIANELRWRHRCFLRALPFGDGCGVGRAVAQRAVGVGLRRPALGAPPFGASRPSARGGAERSGSRRRSLRAAMQPRIEIEAALPGPARRPSCSTLRHRLLRTPSSMIGAASGNDWSASDDTFDRNFRTRSAERELRGIEERQRPELPYRCPRGEGHLPRAGPPGRSVRVVARYHEERAWAAPARSWQRGRTISEHWSRRPRRASRPVQPSGDRDSSRGAARGCPRRECASRENGEGGSKALGAAPGGIRLPRPQLVAARGCGRGTALLRS